MDPIALTRRLIDIESISGNEGAVGAELYEVLLNMGYTTHKMPVAHERFNVVATIDGQKPELVFLHPHGHRAAIYFFLRRP